MILYKRRTLFLKAQNPFQQFSRNFPVDGEADNLLLTCYGETGAMDFGRDPAVFNVALLRWAVLLCRAERLAYCGFSFQFDVNPVWLQLTTKISTWGIPIEFKMGAQSNRQKSEIRGDIGKYLQNAECKSGSTNSAGCTGRAAFISHK